MGIKGLIQLINKHTGNTAIKKYAITRFTGMKLAIDASAIVYQSVLATRASGRDMKNKNGEITSHLHGIMTKILKLLEYKIIPIFVFDGKPPKIKKHTIDKRNEKRKLAEEALRSLSPDTPVNDETYLKNFKSVYKPTKLEFTELKIMLDLMGIPYICAPGEADVICAWLAARTDANGRRHVKGVCTDDSDILTLGSPYIFKDMLRFINRGHMITVVSLYKTLVKMNITMDQFVDLCVLLGCDYCDNIPGVGPETAYKYITTHENIDRIIQLCEEKKPDIDIKTKSIMRAQKYFKNALDEIDGSEFAVTQHNSTLRQFQFNPLMDFMCRKHGFDVFNTEVFLKRLQVYYSRMGVVRINDGTYHKISQLRSKDYNFCYSTDSDLESDSGSDVDFDSE